MHRILPLAAAAGQREVDAHGVDYTGRGDLIVISVRYSNLLLQNEDSADAQEARGRHQLESAGIDHRHAIVLCEKGIRGDLDGDSRQEFNHLLMLIRSGRVRFWLSTSSHAFPAAAMPAN